MSDAAEAPFSYPGLERIFHERGRLAICTCLIAHPAGLSFSELQAACDLTDGNLNRHVHALAELGIVTTEKQRGSGRPFDDLSHHQTRTRAVPRLRRRTRGRRSRRARTLARRRLSRQAGNDVIPRHVAIVMDGNRRWAAQRGLPIALAATSAASRLCAGP